MSFEFIIFQTQPTSVAGTIQFTKREALNVLI